MRTIHKQRELQLKAQKKELDHILQEYHRKNSVS